MSTFPKDSQKEINIKFQHALQLQLQEKNDEAMKIYLDILQIDPNHADTLNNLAAYHLKQGLHEKSLYELEHAIRCAPNSIAIQMNLGKCFLLTIEHLLKRAKTHFTELLDNNPSDPQMIKGYAHIMQLLSSNGGYDFALGNVSFRSKQYEQALSHYQASLKILKNVESNVLRLIMRSHKLLGQYAQAEQVAQQILSEYPDDLDTLQYLAVIYSFAGRWQEALETCEAILRVNPQNIDVLFIKGELLLRFGNYPTGLPYYELRFDASNAKEKCRKFDEPLWDGSPLNGRTLLIHKEQGRGDNIQFVRYIKLIKKNGGKIILETLPDLIRLMKCLPEIDEVIPLDCEFPPHDIQTSIMSLPYIFHTTVATIPDKTPYIDIPTDPALSLPNLCQTNKLKVGFAWQGSKTNSKTHHRSIALKEFSTLFKADHVQFFNLQFGLDDNEQVELKHYKGIIDLTPHCTDYLDSARCIQQLDLIITVDTALAHLAGALDIPVWTLLSFSSDWRWLLERDDTPWYPSMRLFRQTTLDDWGAVLNKVLAALESEMTT